MIGWLFKGLRSRRLTTPYPNGPEPASAEFRGRAAISTEVVAAEQAQAAAAACLPDALTVTDRGALRLDATRCINCGLCVGAVENGAVKMEARFELAGPEVDTLVVESEGGGMPAPGGRDVGAQGTANGGLSLPRAFRRSIHIRHVDAGSDGAVEQEIAALQSPYYDMQRLGLFFTATPRHADVLLVTGAVTAPMEDHLRRTYEAMPDPRIVVAAGTDACSGGIWTGPEVRGGVDKVLPVDVYIPGDPPAPITLLHGLLLATGRVAPAPAPLARGRAMSALGLLLAIGSSGLLAAALLAVAVPDLGRARLAVALVGCAAAVALAVGGGMATFGTQVHWEWFGGFGLGSGGFSADRLSGLFVLISCAAAAPLLLASSGGTAPGARLAAALRPLLVLAVIGVYLADNVFVFLVVWELSVLAIFALVAVRYEDEAASRAADLTITLAKLGGGAILAGFLLLAAETGSFSFAELAQRAPDLDPALRGVCFALFFAGFGVKAALVPMQTWLPSAYGESNAESAGLLAAVGLNIAFYGMLRTWFGFLGQPEVWWAVVALLGGSVTALLGILGGIVQTRLRVFIAYSSIENSGIIVTALGIALMGLAQGERGLFGLGLIAATFQITTHAIAKAGLFTAAASVEAATGTDDMERLGGLYRALPLAALGALSGAAALSALPPFSGFASEWMTFEGLMQGFRVSGTGSHLAMALAGAHAGADRGADGACLRAGAGHQLPRHAAPRCRRRCPRLPIALARPCGPRPRLAGDRRRRTLDGEGPRAGNRGNRRRGRVWADLPPGLADRARLP